MFSNAIAEAREYTRSVVVLYKFTDGRVKSKVGTYVHLDDLGHILTANHVLQVGSESQITNFDVIFDGRYFKLDAEYVAQDFLNDLALIRIRTYQPRSIKAFPKFLTGSSGELPRGTPLVRLGYPISESHISATWDEANNDFNMDRINTRLTCVSNYGKVVGYEARENGLYLLEMNTAVLNGQSGGPVLTSEGAIAGLVSRNTGYDSEPETGRAATHMSIAHLLEKHLAPKFA